MEVEEKKVNKNLSISERWQAVGYYASCQDQEKTAQHFNASQSTISRLLAKVRNVNDVADYRKSGRPQSFSLKDEDTMREKIEDMIDENKYFTSKQVAEELEVAKGTALKILSKLGLTFSKAVEIPQLNKGHIEKRFNHAKILKDRQIDDIVFTDESYFQLFRNVQGTWHFEDELNVIPKPQTKISLMVYGAISWYGKSEIHICEQGFKVNSVTYCEILSKVLIPFAKKTYVTTRKKNQKKEWILLQDNAPCHRSHYTTQFLTDNNVKKIEHPPNSPDLNPIELVWAILKSKVEKCQCKNKEQLKESIKKEWNNINQQSIQNCIYNFKERINKVYQLNGNFI
ncbi:hypothetical protein ABPG72_002161 [Tetrahymena utriculariae]